MTSPKLDQRAWFYDGENPVQQRFSTNIPKRDQVRKTLISRKVRPHMASDVVSYLFDHVPAGGALTALIRGDVYDALGRGDVDFRARELVAIGETLYLFPAMIRDPEAWVAQGVRWRRLEQEAKGA